MAKIHINIGSNIERRVHIEQALMELKCVFGEINCSSIYQSPAAGFVGDDFYNIGVNIETTLNIEQVRAVLQTIENEMGRDRSQPKFSNRTIDLDLVLYDEVISKQYNLPRGDILTHAFVLAPLVELMPDAVHQLTHKSYQTLWDEFDLPEKQRVKRL